AQDRCNRRGPERGSRRPVPSDHGGTHGKEGTHMRSTMTTGALEPLSETNLALADSTEDIRGLKVYDRSGSEFGKIDDVFIDPVERRARFVAVKSGDIL